jgi:hypothetical protein
MNKHAVIAMHDIIPGEMQCAAFVCTSERVRNEFARVFPDLDAAPPDTTHKLLVCITFQRTSVDLVSQGPAAEEDKRANGERFLSVASLVCASLRGRGHWADMADPATGYPVLGTRGGHTHNDLETVERFLHYPSTLVGSCCVTDHPSNDLCFLLFRDFAH